MPKYANNQQFIPREENAVVSGIGNSLQNIAQGYAQGLEKDRQRVRTQSLLQKYASAKTMNEKLGVLFEIDPQAAGKAMADEIENARLRDFFGNKEPVEPLRTNISNQVGNIESRGFGQASPRQMPLDNVPQAIGDEREGSVLKGLSDEKLKEGIGLFPKAAGVFKEELADRRLQKKLNSKIEAEDREEIRKYSEPYKNIESLEKQVRNVEEAIKLVESGKVSFDENKFRNFMQAIAEGKGKESLAEIAKTPEQQKLFTLMRPFLQTKDIGGSNPSTKEVLIEMSTLPNPYKGKAANLYILQNMLHNAKLNLEKGKAITEARGMKGLSFADFQNQIEQRLSPSKQIFENELKQYGNLEAAKETIRGKSPRPGHVFMMDPEGNVREVSKPQVNDALKNNGVLLKK